MEQAGAPLALDRDACGVAEVAVRSGRGSASVSRATLGYEVQRARHRGACVTLHSGVEVRAARPRALLQAADRACEMLAWRLEPARRAAGPACWEPRELSRASGREWLGIRLWMGLSVLQQMGERGKRRGECQNN
jgi:hypothetical protein